MLGGGGGPEQRSIFISNHEMRLQFSAGLDENSNHRRRPMNAPGDSDNRRIYGAREG